MGETVQAETAANGKPEVKDPTIAGEGSDGKTDSEALAKATEDSDGPKGDGDKDATDEKAGNAQSNGDKDASQSPDNKRKGNDDHYRDGNKRSRGRGDGRGGRGGRGRGGGRGNFGAKNANIVTRFDDQPESDDPVEIRRQVEFYFSDSNLPVDGYLLGMVEGSKNLPVDLRKIHSFKRMRHFQPFSAVAEAVKGSEVLEIEERDNTAYVKRRFPLHEKFTMDTSDNKKLLTSDTMERSIYAKGFGEEKKSTFLDVEEFFEPYGPINSIRLRRDDRQNFKGSVFVEFADVGTQQRFLELDPKPTWGEDGKELQIMSKQAYVDLKHEDILNGNVRPKSPRHSGYTGHGGSSNFRKSNYNNRDGKRRYSDNRDRSRSPNRDDWNARRDRDQRNGNRDDRKRSGRGGGRGGRGRGRGGRDDRRRRDRDGSEERSRSRSPYRKHEDGDKESMPNRAEAEAKKDANGAADASAGAEKVDGESKKRGRDIEDDSAKEGGEAKKVKETEVEA